MIDDGSGSLIHGSARKSNGLDNKKYNMNKIEVKRQNLYCNLQTTVRVGNKPRHEKTGFLHYAKTKAQISCALTAQLISAFDFATQYFRPLACVCDCTGRFVSGNPEDRFSRVVAQIRGRGGAIQELLTMDPYLGNNN